MIKKKLFNINISTGGFKELLELSVEYKYAYACFCNSHMVYEHYINPQFTGIIDEADFVFPDGMPLIYSLRILEGVKQDRIAGNDAIKYLIEMAQNRNLRLFFLGGTETVLTKIKQRMTALGIMAQYYSPPFKPIESFDFKTQAKIINSFKPDIVLVGLGCPKQEIWMNKMKTMISSPMYGLGGAFLFYAGIDSRAPKWMRDLSIEWAYRLFLEPKRLFKRYLVTNSYFCILFIKGLFKKVFNR